MDQETTTPDGPDEPADATGVGDAAEDAQSEKPIVAPYSPVILKTSVKGPILTPDQIAKSLDLPTEEVEVPEWGGTITLRGLPSGNAWYLKFVEGTKPSPSSIAAGLNQLPLKPEQKAAQFEKMIKRMEYPSEQELITRSAIASVILCAMHPDGVTPIFDMKHADDHAAMLRTKQSTVYMNLSARIFELAHPETLEEAKND